MTQPSDFDEARELLRASGLVFYDDFLVDLPSSTPSDSGVQADEKSRELARVRNFAATTAAEDGPVYLGAGDYDHHIPSSVDQLASRLELHRSISDGRDELSHELQGCVCLFQQTVCRLTGMAAANAALYRSGSPLGHACHAAVEATGRPIALVPKTTSPEALARLDAYARVGAFELKTVPSRNGTTDLDALRTALANDGARIAAVVAPYPNFYGCLERVGQISDAAHAAGALFVMAVDPVALAILRSPAEWGADIAVGDVHTSPARRDDCHVRLGFVATSRHFLETAPPTLVRRVAEDSSKLALSRDFGRGERLLKQPRVRAIDSLRTLVQLAYSNARDLRRVAKVSHERAKFAHDTLAKAGFEFLFDAPFLREFAVKFDDPEGMNAYLEKWGIVGGRILDDGLVLAFTEKRSEEEIEELVYFMSDYRDRGRRGER